MIAAAALWTPASLWGPVTLWSHALAALVFAVLAWSQAGVGRGAETGAGLGGGPAPSRGDLPRRALAAALGATALWALAVAGIGPDDIAARVVEGARDLAWLGVTAVLAHRLPGRDRPAIVGAHAAVALAIGLVVTLSLIAGMLDPAAVARSPAGLAEILSVRLALEMVAAAGGLLLAHRLHATAREGTRLALAGFGALWALDLAVFVARYAGLIGPEVAAALRGLVAVTLAPVFAVATSREGDWRLSMSRTMALRSLVAMALAAWIAATALLTGVVGALAGGQARLFQTAAVFGSAATLLAFVSTPWLGAWIRVKLSKHLFRHRYDYRAEWLRFTDTLGRPADAAEPLGRRVVNAVADLTCSPAGVLLVPDGGALGLGATWRWDGALPAVAGDEALARLLATSPRIVELDAVRAAVGGAGGGEEAAAIPQWMLDHPDAWAIVPLPHFDVLAGAILLARPPVARRLDWEDFDLLRLAARQAASYLAEERAGAALADATRFDEFNRRFAFIMHDIKNLVSQLTLVARNAERHADNPDFRADMVATLRDCADRMNALLARLSQHHGARGDPLQPVEVSALVEAIARRHRAVHPVATRVAPVPPALADAGLLEQLLGHLVQNAIEASAATEPVTLAVSLARLSAGDRVVVEVIDRGCGMAPAFVRDQLFRPFVSSKPGGFGIGAFEARQLVQSMNGSIAVSSREGEGTCFRVALPVAAAPALERAA